MTTWIFQGNPDRFNVDRYISTNNQIYWTVKHKSHQQQINIGDTVYFWRAAGKNKNAAGIIAKGVINEECKPKNEVNNPELLSEFLWTDESDEPTEIKAGILIEEKRLIPSKGMITRTVVKNDNILSESTIIKASVGSNFILSDVQSEQVETLWKSREDYTCRSLELGKTFNREEAHDIFSPTTEYIKGAGTWGILGILPIDNREKDYVFMVTYGQSQSGHEFDEGITKNGVLTWQSQPSQNLSDPQIQTLINHDDKTNIIHLFIRNNGGLPYTYLGGLKYINHDSTREKPIYFQWQLKQWNDIDSEIKKPFITSNDIEEIEKEESLENQLQIVENPEFATRQRRKGLSTNEFRTRKSPDYDNIERSNRKIGLAGEKLVIKHEKERLESLGCKDLADKINHVSVKEGDGAGYDIESFEEDGSVRYIEVKTTKGGLNTGFYISSNEIRRSHCTENYFLYRVFNFSNQTNSGELYIKKGPIEKSFELKEENYKAIPLNMFEEEECIFCGDLDSKRIIFQLGSVFAVKDKFQVSEGHTLIIPYRHVIDYFSMNSSEKKNAETLIEQIKIDLLSKDSSISGFNIGMNCGESAGQTVSHAHIHVIPRRDGDVENPRGGVRGVIPGKMDY